ncbi:MAG: DUF92 domain-containing protein [Acidobacteria bacterium]|nr:DUF92 domain-containing protein [Acidobacteriota bacterium]MBV9478674.1 DUF92 domain-containing protein [Acidobacteriota bacterium]
MPAHVTNETLRKSLHIAFGLVAFALKWLSWPMAAAVCVVAIVSNWLVLHRLVGRAVARHERGYDAGIVLYPVAVLLLILVFHDALHFAAIGWMLLAFGDGIATLAGKAFRLAPLPWNRDKSLGGLIAFVVLGGAGALAVAYWMNYREPLVVLIATLAAALVESMPLGVDDNLAVPFAASVALLVAGIHPTLPYSTWPHTPAWLLVNGALALLGYFARSVSFSGALGGFLLGTIIILGAGWPLYVALLAFFIIGTGATKLGYQRKAKRGLAEGHGGRRGISHAFANVGTAAICAIAVSRLARAAAGQMEYELLPLFMGIASLATAAADTTASEIGQLLGKRAFLPLTLRRVPTGTEGAISVEGTLAGAIGGFIVALVSTWAVDRQFFGAIFSWSLVGALALCAFSGSYLESLAGSWNRRHGEPMPNGVLNFFNTVAGAVLFYYAQLAFGLFDWHAYLQRPMGGS